MRRLWRRRSRKRGESRIRWDRPNWWSWRILRIRPKGVSLERVEVADWEERKFVQIENGGGLEFI